MDYRNATFKLRKGNQLGSIAARSKEPRPRGLPLVAMLLVLTALLSSCSWPWVPKAAPSSTPKVSVAFPESPEELKAKVEPLPPSQEMTDALPAGAQLHEGVSLSMESGGFPERGADITFQLDEPLAEGSTGTVVHWNPQERAWEPVESSLSADRLNLISHVKHFSDYNWIETFYNGLGKALGDKTDPPGCGGGTPEWADPAYSKDNINAPVLWCVGTDGNNPDIMEVRLKINRPSAASIVTAIKPAWAWSDLWQNLAPQTWAQLAAQSTISSNQLGEQYLLQPLGEYRFGFHRKQLMELYNKSPNTPLISVDSTITYTVAGLMYQALEGKAAGNFAGVFIMTSLLECSGNLAGSAGDSVGSAFGALGSCLNDRKDAIAVATAKAWLKMNPAASWDESVASGKKIGGVIRTASGWYALVKGGYSIGGIVGDLTLDPFLRQLTFSPSLTEIKRQIEERKAAEAKAEAAVPGLPTELAGKWCSRKDAGKCFSATEKQTEFPAFSLDSTYSDSRTRTTRYSLCTERDLGDGCTTSRTIYLEYFPAGVGWDCVRQLGNPPSFPGCSPDYTSEHDVSVPRIVIRPNHQHSTFYVDAEPLYRLK